MKVSLAHSLLLEHAKFEGTCLLDPHGPLIVAQQPSDRPDGLIFAKVQGKTAVKWPFCPPQAEVLLARHQIMGKADVVFDSKNRLMGWWKQ